MAKSHLKRINAPATWPITRKATKFTLRPESGGHPMEYSLPLSILLKDELKMARTLRSVKTLLNTQEVLVNGRKQLRADDIAGLMDVVTFPAIKTSFRMLIDDKKKLHAIPITGKEAGIVPSKVTSKHVVRKGKLQLGFHNGKTLLVDKYPGKVGSTVMLSLDNKIESALPLEKGMFVLVTSGKHTGTTGTVEQLDNGTITIKTKEKTFTTQAKHAFVLGKGKSEIKVEA